MISRTYLLEKIKTIQQEMPYICAKAKEDGVKPLGYLTTSFLSSTLHSMIQYAPHHNDDMSHKDFEDIIILIQNMMSELHNSFNMINVKSQSEDLKECFTILYSMARETNIDPYTL